MKKFTKQNGITLIALIITIIVMLILVAVTINVVLNGGLFDKANNASKNMEEQTIYETIIASMELKNNGNIDVKKTYENAENSLLVESKTVSPDSNTIEQDAKSAVMIVTGSRGTYKYTIKEGKIIIGEEIEEGEKNAFATTIEYEGQQYPLVYSYTNYKNAWFLHNELLNMMTIAVKNQEGKIVGIYDDIILDIESEPPTITDDGKVTYGTLEHSDYFENYTSTYYTYKKEGDESTEYNLYEGYYMNDSEDDIIYIKINPNGDTEFIGFFDRSSLVGISHSAGGTFRGKNSEFYSEFTTFDSGDVKGLEHNGKTIIVTNTDDTQEKYTLIEFN